jgi:hypothetical protein
MMMNQEEPGAEPWVFLFFVETKLKKMGVA